MAIFRLVIPFSDADQSTHQITRRLPGTLLTRVDLERNRLFVPRAKAGMREQPITPELAQILNKEREIAADPKGWIFPEVLRRENLPDTRIESTTAEGINDFGHIVGRFDTGRDELDEYGNRIGNEYGYVLQPSGWPLSQMTSQSWISLTRQAMATLRTRQVLITMVMSQVISSLALKIHLAFWLVVSQVLLSPVLRRRLLSLKIMAKLVL